MHYSIQYSIVFIFLDQKLQEGEYVHENFDYWWIKLYRRISSGKINEHFWGGGIVCTGRNPRFKEYYGSISIPYCNVDVCNYESFSILDKYQFDAAILFATMMPSNVEKNNDKDDTAEYYKVNVIGTLNTLEYCRKRGINKLISFGTRFDCRLYDSETIITEESPLKYSFTDDHAAFVMSNNAKWDVMRYYNEKYGMNNVFFRIPTIFGVGPHGSFYKNGVYKKSGLQIFIDKASKGEAIEIYGNPHTMKDILYVKDLTIGVQTALKKSESKGFYNIGYDVNFSLFDIVKAIIEVFSPTNATSEIIFRPDIANSGSFPTMDISKLKREIGFIPIYSNILAMMKDYKYELKRGLYPRLFNCSNL